MTPIKVAISVVNHLHDHDIKLLISSFENFLRASSLISVEVYILNNIPTKEVFKSDTLNIVALDNLRPNGFGANHNQVFAAVNCDYFFIVNPDVYLIQEFDLDAYLKLHQYSDIVSPVQTDQTGRAQSFVRRDVTFINLVKRVFIKEKCSYDNFDWICGAFLSISSEAFTVLRGFDPGYFMYVEDCDLCMRARLSNLNLRIAKEHKIVHKIGGLSSKKLRHFVWHISSVIRYRLRQAFK